MEGKAAKRGRGAVKAGTTVAEHGAKGEISTGMLVVVKTGSRFTAPEDRSAIVLKCLSGNAVQLCTQRGICWNSGDNLIPLCQVPPEGLGTPLRALSQAITANYGAIRNAISQIAISQMSQRLAL